MTGSQIIVPSNHSNPNIQKAPLSTSDDWFALWFGPKHEAGSQDQQSCMGMEPNAGRIESLDFGKSIRWLQTEELAKKHGSSFIVTDSNPNVRDLVVKACLGFNGVSVKAIVNLKATPSLGTIECSARDYRQLRNARKSAEKEGMWEDICSADSQGKERLLELGDGNH